MCNKSEESIEHLLLHCEENYGVRFFNCLGLHGMPQRVKVVSELEGTIGTTSKMWKLPPLCLMWCV
jgi:hypothetical protein